MFFFCYPSKSKKYNLCPIMSIKTRLKKTRLSQPETKNIRGCLSPHSSRGRVNEAEGRILDTTQFFNTDQCGNKALQKHEY